MTPSAFAEVVLVVTANAGLAWLATYLVHSTAAVGGAWALARWTPLAPNDEAWVWRVAATLPLATATAQSLGAAPSLMSIDLPAAAYAALSNWRISGLLAAAFALVPLVFVVATARGAMARGRILGRRAAAPDAVVRDAGALARLRSRRAPRVTVSATVPAPAAVGASEICVPADTFTTLPLDQQRSLLAHELGHLARGDNFWMACAGAVAVLTPFQPLNRLARARLGAASEKAADDFAVGLTGDRESLSRALAALVSRAPPAPGAASAAGSPIVQRVERLLNPESERRPIRASRHAGLAFAVAAALALAVAPAVRMSPKTASNAIDWLAPSREAPSARMRAFRESARAWRLHGTRRAA